MSDQTPSATLLAAADRIRDLAAAATEGPWTVVETDHARFDADAGKHVDPDYAYLNNASNAWFGRSCGCCTTGTIGPDTARWVAALSPAVAPMIEQLLRSAAATCEQAAREGWTAEEMRAEADADMRAALDLAGAILGSGVDIHG